MRRFVSALVPAVLTGITAAQTATVDVSHNDPNGIVLPGQTVRITARHTRSASSLLAGVGGDIVATGDLGQASNFRTDLFPGTAGSYPGSLGTPSSGSVYGVRFEFVSHPLFVPTVSPPYANWLGIEVLSYDWTAPSVAQPTTVSFDWIPSAAFPDVYAIIPPYNGLHWAYLPTTYTGTSLIVVPTPATLGVFALALITPRRRRSGSARPAPHHITRACIPAALACTLTGAASAQTAMVAVSHNDPDGIVSPGETVRITARHTRSSDSILAGIGGDIVATSNLGQVFNFETDLFPGTVGSYPGSLGTAVGGSVFGVRFEFISHPVFVPTVSPAYGQGSGVVVISYDWTAPSVAQPTTIDFDWVPSAAYPDVYAIVPPFNELHWAFLPTTYTGTSLLVLPTPATLGVLGLGFFVPRRRR